MPNLKQVAKKLPVMASELNNLYNDMEKTYLRACVVMGDARSYFDDDDDFWEWVENNTRFSKKQRLARQHLQIAERVLSVPGASEATKTMQYKALVHLSRTNLSKVTIKKVFRLYLKADKNRDAVPLVEAVNKIVREAMPPETGKRDRQPSIELLPSFYERAKRCLALEESGGLPQTGSYLFALRGDATPEDIKAVSKHWKQKFHPDKGGDADIFEIIIRYSKLFLSRQSETGK